MEDLECEIIDLKEKNTELVKTVQFWKMTAAQKENEKLDLIKEINDLRLKLNRLRNGSAAGARKLDAALQSSCEEALSALVQASGAVARALELGKTYMQDQQELDTALPRWSMLTSTPSAEKINKVPPMLIGGRLIQPVVSLSRTLHTNYSGSVRRRPNETNHSISERVPLPIHMLQDLYIPLTRIDASELPVNNVGNHMETNEADNSTEDLGLDDSTNRIKEETENVTETEDFGELQILDVVSEEDIQGEDNLTAERSSMDNPLEGPSWLLDRPLSKRKMKSLINLEPDSTTEFADSRINNESRPSTSNPTECNPPTLLDVGTDISRCEFTPTVRRRQRASPPASPPASPRPHRKNGRILKVLVAKMRLDDDLNDASPPKRSKDETPKSAEISPISQTREISPSKVFMRFDAPSPNGATDSRVIVLESKHNQPQPGCSGISKPRTLKRVNSNDGRSGRDNSKNKYQSDGQNGRQNDIQNRQHSDTQCDNNDIRHQDDSQNKHQRRSRIRCQSDNASQSHDSHNDVNISERDRHDSASSGTELISEGSRARRPRKAVVYREKPLNRKLRR